MRCTLCNNTNFEIISSKIRHNIPRKVISCKKCTLTCLENPEKNLVDYKKSYRKKHSPILGQILTPVEFHKFSTEIFQKRLSRIESLLKSNSSVLEIGSSTGHFLQLIKDRVSDCTGIELDKKFADFAKNKLNLNIYKKPLEKIDFQGKKFDIIFMFQVLEHIPKPLELLQLCKKILKPKGKIYVEVPNLDDALLSIYSISEFQKFYFRAPHVYYYNKKTLFKIMKKLGFNGKVKTIQEYSVYNHINWIQNEIPQTDQKIGYSPLKWNYENSNNLHKAKKMEKWFEKFNQEYKEQMEKLDLGEHVSFLGQKN